MPVGCFKAQQMSSVFFLFIVLFKFYGVVDILALTVLCWGAQTLLQSQHVWKNMALWDRDMEAITIKQQVYHCTILPHNMMFNQFSLVQHKVLFRQSKASYLIHIIGISCLFITHYHISPLPEHNLLY